MWFTIFKVAYSGYKNLNSVLEGRFLLIIVQDGIVGR